MIIPLKGGDEHDALSGWKKYHSFRAKQRKSIKKRYNKRLRRYFKVFDQGEKEWKLLEY